MGDCPHGHEKRTCETCELLAERNRLRAVARDVWAALWHADPDEVELLSAEHETMLPGAVRAAMLAAAQHNTELSNERDRLAEQVTELSIACQSDEGRMLDLRDERDAWKATVTRMMEDEERLRAVLDGYIDDLSHIAFAVAGHRTGVVHHDDILGLVQSVVAERNRLRAALRLIAIPPIHIPDVSEGCEGCARTARRALDGEDFSELADQLDGSAEPTDG